MSNKPVQKRDKLRGKTRPGRRREGVNLVKLPVPSPDRPTSLRTRRRPCSPTRMIDAPPSLPPAAFEDAQDLQTLQVAALERVQRMLEHLPSEERAARATYETALGLMQAALSVLTRHTEVDDVRGVLDPVRFRAFASMLHQRRRAARMSREELGARAGLHASTIRNIERVKQAPSRTTLCRLLAVPELGLQVKDIADDVAVDPAWQPNAWFAPRYDAARLFGEMVEMLAGPGGTLEQTYLYLDPQSAADWLNICKGERFTSSWRSACPLEQIAARITRLAGSAGLDVVGLGAGDGRNETRLVRALAELRPPPPPLSLKLLDISHTLVNTASKTATEQLAPHQVPVVALHANFHDLARYPVLHCTPQSSHLRRVYLLLGYTMANLDNEVRWFTDLTTCTSSGDLAVLDFQLAYGPVDNAAALWQVDPGLQQGLPPSYFTWLSGPIRRHCPNASAIDFETKLNTQCLVPGAYELQAIARTRLPDGAERRFTVFRNRRYDAERLAQCLEGLGWC